MSKSKSSYDTTPLKGKESTGITPLLSGITIEAVNDAPKLGIEKYDLENLDNIRQYTSDFFVIQWAEQLVKWVITKGVKNVEYVITIPHTDSKTKKEKKPVLSSAIAIESIKKILLNVFGKYEEEIQLNSSLKQKQFEFEFNKHAIQYFTMTKIKDITQIKSVVFPETVKSPTKDANGNVLNIPDVKYAQNKAVNLLLRQQLEKDDEFTKEQIESIIDSLRKKMVSVKIDKSKVDKSKQGEVEKKKKIEKQTELKFVEEEKQEETDDEELESEAE